MLKIKGDKRIICRLHSYEAFTQMPAHVQWDKVDDLIFVNPSVQKLMQGFGMKFPDSLRQHVIPNAVETDKWRFFDVHEKKNKIAFLGHLNYKKDASMLLPISESLAQTFPRMTIHVAGEFQDMRYKLMFDQYDRAVNPDNLILDGYQKNVNGWLEDKKYNVNTSLFESFNYGIAEGMLVGALPLIRNWYGVENIWPNATTWNTIAELMNLIKYYEELPTDDFKAEQEENRQFVIDTYGFDKIIKQIEELIQ
jgi:glycosyltransferase involved in cell wall biosynthesis